MTPLPSPPGADPSRAERMMLATGCKVRRALDGLTLSEAARRLKIPQGQYRCIEQGRRVRREIYDRAAQWCRG